MSGITPALSASWRVVTAEAIKTAKQAGCLVSFDMNYRARLWSPEEARECIGVLLHDVNILITTSDDAAIVFDMEGEPTSPANLWISMA